MIHILLPLSGYLSGADKEAATSVGFTRTLSYATTDEIRSETAFRSFYAPFLLVFTNYTLLALILHRTTPALPTVRITVRFAEFSHVTS